MFRQWLRARRSLIATLTSGTAICALIATVAVVSTGYRAQQVDLGDGAVWVVNNTREAVGRANTQVFELNAGIPVGSDQLDIVQDGKTVLVVDSGQSTVSIVDPATAEIVESVPLPPRLTDVQLGGDRLTVNAAGDIWFIPIGDLESFESESEPALSFGPGAISSVSPSGDVFVFSPEAGEVYRIGSGDDTVSSTTQVAVDSDGGGFQLSSVGAEPVLLDGASNRLIVRGATVDLGDSENAILPQPAASGSSVLVGAAGRLLSVPLSGGEPTELVTEADGLPVRPVTVDGCDYAAWSGGDVLRRCEGNNELTDLTGTGGALDFRVNAGHVVLNDSTNGTSWAVQTANEKIDNWDELLNVDEDEQQIDDTQEDTPPEYEEAQLPPTAVDDAFGARPGRTSPLPVLLNDVDPNGDVLMIDSFTALNESVGKLDLVNNAQQLQVTLAPDAVGELRFDYTISDGRKGTSTATVTITVRAEGENGPPEQVRNSKASVAAGGRLTAQTLGDWVDPDGDPFYLTGASVPAPDQVQYTPDGTLVYTDAGLGGALKEIGLVASDGIAEGSGSFAVTVYPPNEVPIIAEPFPVVVYAGQEVLVSPLPHVRGGSGPLRLANVPAKSGVTITPDYDGGTFRFFSSEPGTHNVEYSVTDGNRTATGIVRIQVSTPPGVGAPPVTVPHTAYIREQSTQRVDVLSGDFDPAGGVLVITGVENVPPASGLQVEILEQRILRVTLTTPLNAPVSFNYLVSNGTAEATGTVTVIEIPTPVVRQPPVAYPDSISVRVGDAIDIPVLKNDTHPDGDTLALSPALSTELPSDAGLLFASGRILRYLAPDKPGNFTASYRAIAPDGQWADAHVTLNVREVDAASNAAPVPEVVTARVLSGERVRITIPLTGIDPDGDSVQLVGQASNPGKGAVVDSGENWFDYEAGAYSTGTDTFDYTVIDALGSQATGTVRVGISGKLDGSRTPIAMADEVITRPDRTIAVQVLLNDSDPDGGQLSVTSVDPTSEGATAEIDGDLVRVSVPEGEGRFGFVYEIENKWGNTSRSFLTVVTRDDAPLARPVPGDVVLTLDDILERTTVDVNVLSRVFFAEGSVSGLQVSLPREHSGTEVLDSKRVRVTVAPESQIIPFQVSRPDDRGISAIAFIWVPGLNDALPQLRPGVKPITVVSGEPVTIDINDYVLAVGRKDVRLTDAAKVRASHANGADLVVDADTISYTSAERYFGPASLSFEVTDGSSATDPGGRIATIVLPLDVAPRENQPPVFAGGVLEFQPGEKKVIELAKLTTYPYDDDLDELRYSILDPRPGGFSASISGQKLTLTADAAIPIGTTSGILIGVRDAVNEGEAGRLVLDVAPSTRPIAVPAADSAVVQRGTTEVIDVLENDAATNPFPSTPLRVIAVRGLGGALPTGVTVSPSADNSRLSVSVAADAAPSDATLQYQVADATNDPSRYAWGSVRISVQDRPGPVTNVRMTGFGDRAVTLAWEPGASNNSPITGFSVELFRAGSGESLGTTTCPATTCEVSTPGNGRDNTVRAQVSAINAIGASDAQRLVDPVWSDVVPAAPRGVSAAPLDGGLRIGWDAVVPQRGSSVKAYVLTVGGGTPINVGPDSCSASRCSTRVDGLANGSQITFTVSARNDAYPALSTWNSSSGSATPAGAPVATGAPSVTVGTTSATVSWDGMFGGNGRSVTRYYAAAVGTNAAFPTCTVTGVDNGNPTLVVDGTSPTFLNRELNTSAEFPGLAQGAEYQFVVYAYNGQGCTRSSTAITSTIRGPGIPTNALFSVVPNGKGQYDIRLDGVDWVTGGGEATFLYTLTIGGQQISGRTNGPGILSPLAYGDKATVSIEVCETHRTVAEPLCSGLSPAFDAGVPTKTPPAVLSYSRIDESVSNDGAFSWVGAPSGGGYASVRFSCDDGATWALMPSEGTCAAVAATGVWPSLIVEVTTVDGRVYTDGYRADAL